MFQDFGTFALNIWSEDAQIRKIWTGTDISNINLAGIKCLKRFNESIKGTDQKSRYCYLWCEMGLAAKQSLMMQNVKCLKPKLKHFLQRKSFFTSITWNTASIIFYIKLPNTSLFFKRLCEVLMSTCRRPHKQEAPRAETDYFFIPEPESTSVKRLAHKQSSVSNICFEQCWFGRCGPSASSSSQQAGDGHFGGGGGDGIWWGSNSRESLCASFRYRRCMSHISL